MMLGVSEASQEIIGRVLKSERERLMHLFGNECDPAIRDELLRQMVEVGIALRELRQ